MILPNLLKEVLVQGNYIATPDVERAEQFAASHHVPLEDALFNMGLVTTDLLRQAMAEHFALPYANLSAQTAISADAGALPEQIAKTYRVIAVERKGRTATIASDNPKDPAVAEALQKELPGVSIEMQYALPQDIDAALRLYRKPLSDRFAEILTPAVVSDKNPVAKGVLVQLAPRLIEEIVSEAISFQASDLHFEPQEKEVVVRFRIDGVLHEAGRIPIEHYSNILNRLKVQAHVRIDEHFIPQDGAIRYRAGKDAVDMRVSIIPTLDGEKIAIRLLGEYVGNFSLEDLGLSPGDKQLIQEASDKPFGMILISGPTGSGKTTVLYALLKLLNEPDVNITTIEDPVEYKVLGVNQVQVNPEADLTFANGLRSIVRQDPDVILVGEIRDNETADIAVNAALTGHLLLSTFHANDAATTIPRLLEMDIEPFLLASTLELVIARRLVRKICEQCRYSVSAEKAALQKLVPTIEHYFPDATTVLYAGKGCKACNGIGYRGRVGIFEIIKVTPAMRELILKHPSTQEVWKLAAQEGSHSLFEDGIQKVKNGLTTIQEVLRVASPSS